MDDTRRGVPPTAGPQRRPGGEAPLLEYRAILDHAGLAILFTRDRRIYRCNRRSAELFGWPDEAALTGQSGKVLFRNEQDFAELSRNARPILAAGGIFKTEFELAQRSGRPIKTQIVASAIDPANPRDGAIWIIDDITERYRQRLTSERLLREHQIIFHQALVGIMFVRGRTIEHCNGRLEEIFGHPAGALNGRSTRILFATDAQWEATGRRAHAAFADHGRFQGEVEFVRDDGAPIWCRVNGRLADPANPDAGAVWIYEDVTERRRAEQERLASHRELETRVAERTAELRSQLHFLRQLIDAIPSPVSYKDAERRYLGCNKAFESYLGRPQRDIVGKRAGEVFTDGSADRHDARDRALLDHPGTLIYESRTRHADRSWRDLLFHNATFTRPDGTVDGIVSIMLDVTERKEMAERIGLAATVFDSTADGVVIADPQGDIIAVNRAFTEITGYSEAEVRGRNPRLLQSGRQDKAYYAALWSALKTDGRWSGEIWNRRKDGSIYPERLTITAVRNEAGAPTHYVGVFSDITQLKDTQDALDFQAHHDSLTGLPNRLLLEDRLDTALQRARRQESTLAVLFIDLDRFKIINDTLGHQVGDLVLCEAARRFTALVRESDTVARLGGDEFVIIVEQSGDAGAIARIADKLLEELRQPIRVQAQEFFVGASVGIALHPQDGDDRATLLKHADAAMYRAKERGRNTFEFFHREIGAVSVDRFRLEADIRHAIERGELQVHFQPQYSLPDHRLVGAEALLRWRHPGRGLVAPEEFIPLAEETGLIVPIGEWILRQACTAWADWHAEGLAPGVLAVNVSGIEFKRGRIRESVATTLASTNLPPELLEIEITERSIMDQTEAGIQALDELRDMGLQIAIDDFGTGYSSLAYLQRLPITKVKVDRSFVLGLPDQPGDAAIARAIVALARSLQLKTIAEGVETAAQKDFLVAAGCDEAQGFLLGRPVPADAFAGLLRGRQAANLPG